MEAELDHIRRLQAEVVPRSSVPIRSELAQLKLMLDAQKQSKSGLACALTLALARSFLPPRHAPAPAPPLTLCDPLTKRWTIF